MNNCEKCGYYSDGECNICGMGISGEDTFCRLCKDNSNCYYKQLPELKAENAKLNAIIDEYQPKIQALKDEKDKYYQQTLDDEIQINELYQTLQEIKAIAEIAFAVCDDDCGNANKFTEILDLITKAEEE